MNIAFVNATRRWGGVKTWLLDFAEELGARGHATYVYGCQDTFIDAAVRRVGHGVQLRFGCDLNPMTIRFFMQEFRRKGIDVVFVNVKKDLATAGVAASLLGIPVVQQIGLPNDIPYRLGTHLLHACIRPRFLCSARFIEDGFRESLPYLKGYEIHTVLTAKRVDATSPPGNEPRRIIMTQQLNADKGHTTVLKALSGIDLPYELHILGTGNEECALHSEADALGLGDRITWHGFSNDVMGWLRRSDIFILASHSEGLPNTLQEAMAVGLLPIARDVGGVKEVIDGPLTEWILPSSAGPEIFRGAIERALRMDARDLCAIKDAARDAAQRHFSIGRKTNELELLLKDIIGNATTSHHHSHLVDKP